MTSQGRSPGPSGADDGSSHRLVFVGGLHRSGTTPLTRALASHPQVSGFRDTGAVEDEGQHLQSVYPPARVRGGPGRFGRSRAAHLTEASPLAAAENATRLLREWRPHWDLTRPVLVEKSPPNIVMTRFLQHLFPRARLVVVVRHPAIVALSTRKWARGTPLWRLVEHWFGVHDILMADAPHLRHLHVLKYEDLVQRPRLTLAALGAFLELEGEVPDTSLSDRSSSYAARWERMLASRNPATRAMLTFLLRRYEQRANAYGYSLRDLSVVRPFPVASSLPFALLDPARPTQARPGS